MSSLWPGGWQTTCPVCCRSKEHKSKGEAIKERKYLTKRISESFSFHLPYVSMPLGVMKFKTLQYGKRKKDDIKS